MARTYSFEHFTLTTSQLSRPAFNPGARLPRPVAKAGDAIPTHHHTETEDLYHAHQMFKELEKLATPRKRPTLKKAVHRSRPVTQSSRRKHTTPNTAKKRKTTPH